MSEILLRKLTEGMLDDDQVKALIEWQLTKPAEEIDCQLIQECLLHLYPAGQMNPERRDRILEGFRLTFKSQRRRGAKNQIVHRRPKKMMAIILLAALLLALAVTAAAYLFRRGVLNFNEDFGWGTAIVSQEGAEEFVQSGTLAHLELEHVVIDVLEAVYDGAELRIVYGVTSKVAPAYLPPDDNTIYTIPGAVEDEVHMCDYVLVNGQDSYFYDTYETLGDNPNQVLYYLQTNLKAWNVEVMDSETLTIELPMLGKPVYRQKRPMVTFQIPAQMPKEMIRSAMITDAMTEGHEVTIKYAGFSPIAGYVELHFAGISKDEFYRKFDGMGDVRNEQGESMKGGRMEGNTREEDGGITEGFAVMPPADGWPENMQLVVRMQDGEDWNVGIKLQ